MTQTDIDTFGKYLYSKRSPLMTLREFATRVEKSPGYMCDLENDRKDPPSTEVLEKIAEVLSLDDADHLLITIFSVISIKTQSRIIGILIVMLSIVGTIIGDTYKAIFMALSFFGGLISFLVSIPE